MRKQKSVFLAQPPAHSHQGRLISSRPAGSTRSSGNVPEMELNPIFHVFRASGRRNVGEMVPAAAGRAAPTRRARLNTGSCARARAQRRHLARCGSLRLSAAAGRRSSPPPLATSPLPHLRCRCPTARAPAGPGLSEGFRARCTGRGAGVHGGLGRGPALSSPPTPPVWSWVDPSPRGRVLCPSSRCGTAPCAAGGGGGRGGGGR